MEQKKLLEDLLDNLEFKKEQLSHFSEWELLSIQRNCYKIINLIDEYYG